MLARTRVPAALSARVALATLAAVATAATGLPAQQATQPSRDSARAPSNPAVGATGVTGVNPLAVPPSRNLPAVRVALDIDALVPGDQGRVRVRARDDGYLLVLHADPAGRVRVLFPLDPGDAQRVRGGAELTLRSRGGREAFTVGSTLGDGAVLAAVAAAPFRTARFASGGHWGVLPRVPAGGDAEGELATLAGRMAAGRFDYDVAPYRVIEPMPVVTYGGQAYTTGYETEAPAGEQGASAASATSYGGASYYYDDWGFGVPYYGGIFPIVVVGSPFFRCPVGGRGVSFGLFPSCFSVGFVPHGGFPHGFPGHGGRRGWRDDPSFPGNPDFSGTGGAGRTGRRPGGVVSGGRDRGAGPRGIGLSAPPVQGRPGALPALRSRPGALPASPNGGGIVYGAPVRRTPAGQHGGGLRAPSPTPWMPGHPGAPGARPAGVTTAPAVVAPAPAGVAPEPRTIYWRAPSSGAAAGAPARGAPAASPSAPSAPSAPNAGAAAPRGVALPAPALPPRRP